MEERKVGCCSLQYLVFLEWVDLERISIKHSFILRQSLYLLYLKLLNYFCREIGLHRIFQKYYFYLN